MYSAEIEITDTYYNLVVEDYLKQGYNECESQLRALNEIKEHFDIKFKEVADNENM